MFWSLSKASIESSERLNIGSSLYNAQAWSTNAKPFFWEIDANLKTLQKIFHCLWVPYKFSLKSIKSLNQIFWVMEYWFKALECQICSTNTKSFFWERETNLGTLQKHFPYIGVTYKFDLKSVKTLNPVFWVIQKWFTAL